MLPDLVQLVLLLFIGDRTLNKGNVHRPHALILPYDFCVAEIDEAKPFAVIVQKLGHHDR